MNGSRLLGEDAEAEASAGLDAWGAPLCPAEAGVRSGEQWVRFWVHGVALGGVAALGLAGNALAALVLSRPAMRGPSARLLLALAAADALLLFCSLLLFALPALYPPTGRLRHYYTHVGPRLVPALFPLASAAQTLSVYLTVALTAERWVAVCRPLAARALCTEARARWLVLGAAAFALAYNAPRALEVQVFRVQAGPLGAVAYCVRADERVRTPAYVAAYVHWAYLVVMYAVPFPVLAVLNAQIVLRVRRAGRERARLSRSQRRELGLATMLLAVVLVFFLCNLLPLVTNALEVFGEEAYEHLDTLVKVTNLMVCVNSSANFLVYVTLGERFKRVLLATCGCGGGARWGRHRWRRALSGGPGATGPSGTTARGAFASTRARADPATREDSLSEDRPRPGPRASLVSLSLASLSLPATAATTATTNGHTHSQC